MAATAAQIAQLRRMVTEPLSDTYTDEMLATYIESYPLTDENGEPPKVLGTIVSDLVNKLVDNAYWTPTYDLNAAAAAVWEEKASALFEHHDFTADGGTFAMSQKYEHAKRQARRYNARRSAKLIIPNPAPHIHNLMPDQDNDTTNSNFLPGQVP